MHKEQELEKHQGPCACEQYKAYVSDLANIGIRHENSRKYYLSIISALFVLLSLAGDKQIFSALHGHVLYLSGIFGIVLCLVWILHMNSFRAIYRSKFAVLREIENELSLYHAFDREWEELKKDSGYKFLTALDSTIPILLSLLFLMLMLIKWRSP